MNATAPITYRRDGEIGWIEFDDGGANVLNPAAFAAFAAALDAAEADAPGAIVFAGNDKFLCPGLDLKNIASFTPEEIGAVPGQLRDIALRLFTFPRPVVAAVTGHAIGGGAIFLVACDRSVGKSEGIKVGLNEVTIGMPLPNYVVEMARTHLTPAASVTALCHGEVMTAEAARTAGFLDELAEPGAVRERAAEIAGGLAGLAGEAYATTKLRVRAAALERIEAARDEDLGLVAATA